MANIQNFSETASFFYLTPRLMSAKVENFHLGLLKKVKKNCDPF